MKKTFTILTAALTLLVSLAIPMGMRGQTTETLNIETYADANSWVNSTQYLTATVGNVTFTATGGSNTGKYYTSGENWRFYQNENPTLTVSVTSGNTIISVTPTYTVSNNATLLYGTTTVTSEQTINVSGASVTFNVGNSGTATNGQVRFTNIDVTYTTGGTPTTYTVTYDANSGTGTMTDANSPYAAGATVTVMNNTFTYSGYDFDGFNTAADGSGTPYDEGDTFTINANTTLYAQWTPQGGGSATTETLTVGTNGNCTWSNGVKTSQATVGSVTFDALGSGGNDGKYYDSDKSWRFYTANTSGLKVSVPQGNKITSVKITWKTGQPKTPSGFTADGNTSPTTYTADNNTSVYEVSFVKNTANVLFQVLEVTYESLSSVAAPTISPAGCSFTGTKQITITPASGTTLYYTTNGNDPDNSGTGYTTAQTISISATTTVKAIAYSGNEFSSIVSETYTYLTPLTTMQQIFNAATSTATTVAITFGNWVVSGANTSSHAFVTDGTSGFMIYASGHGFTEGDILSGTVVCDVQLYNGAVEITGLKSDTSGLTITPNGTVTVANITMANLAAINTGALVHYENLICEARTEGDYTNYYLSDGTNEIQVYKTLFNNYADYLEDGNTYNITGVFILNNSTKRVNPRSATDIEVISPVINADDVDIAYNTTSGSITYSIDNEPTPAGTLTVSKNGNWLTLGNVTSTTVPFTCSANNSTTARTATVTLTYTYGSNQTVTKSVTVTQAGNTPTPGNYVRIINAVKLTDGCKVIITARYNDDNTNGYRAMTAATTGKPSGVAFTSTTDNGKEILPANITNSAATYYWTVNVTKDGNNTYYTFTNANNQTIGWNSSTSFATGGNNTEWIITRETSNTEAMVANYEGFVIKNANTNTRAFALNGSQSFGPYSTDNMNSTGYNFCLDFFVQESTFTLPIEHWTVEQGTSGNPSDGWYLIASPVAYTLAGQDMVSGTDYDLYRFNPTAIGAEWENYKTHSSSDFKTLEVGKGYLYANKNDITLSFTGLPSYNSEVNMPYAGWNLIGNPLGTAATLDKDFYQMNSTHTGIMPDAGSSVAFMEGVFVYASEANEKATFTQGGGSKSRNENALVINLNRNDNVIDRAIVRFGDSDKLSKFQLFEGSTKIYIPQNGADYAIAAMDDNTQAFSLNFHAKTTGKYTLSLGETSDLSYIHIFDRMTGEDVDMLLEDSYSFIGSPADSEERFIVRLSYNAGNSTNDTFAFQNGSDIIINGEGELQIFDVMGRNIMNTMINGVQTVNVKSNGVYIFKLNEKTQKIIVR